MCIYVNIYMYIYVYICIYMYIYVYIFFLLILPSYFINFIHSKQSEESGSFQTKTVIHQNSQAGRYMGYYKGGGENIGRIGKAALRALKDFLLTLP